MSLKKVSFLAASILIFLVICIPAYAQEDTSRLGKLLFFHSPTCQKCIEVKNELIPDIEKEFQGKILIEYRDITDIQNYKLLLSLKEKYNAQDIKNTLPVFFLEGRFLNGEGEIKEALKMLIAQSLTRPREQERGLPEVDLVARFRAFHPLAIISAGLIDGINPCAFTVMLFFISFLTVQGYRKKELLIIGLSFIFSVFLTYILVGIGIFGFLYHLQHFWLMARIFNFSIGIFSIILGVLALYDFFRFKKTGSTEGLILQLPTGVKNQIHSVIGLHYRKSKSSPGQQRVFIFRLVSSALITGFLVSILEAVCTGQVYLPTIALVLETTHLKLEALGYLLLYNLMFILPLLAIFLLCLFGLASEQFAQIFKRHLLGVKILMAIIFFVLGIFLIYRA
ncbi:MAG: hypothetical protein KKH29_03600 [Candidatus Omnitrophica bacterium]|nr:hypothetical protein [Candidatus Omnitrophota bacterium]